MNRINRRKRFRVAFSLQQKGADLKYVDIINLHWYLTERAIETLPPLKMLLKRFPAKKSKDFSATAIELEMKSAPDLKPVDQAWLTVAKADARQGIHDIGLELTPKQGLPNVEGGAALISTLLAASWQPVIFETLVKNVTEQRKVVLQEKPLETKKIIFKLSFQRIKPGQEPIEIPKEVEILVSDRTICWGFSHIWYNRVILKSINVNFTQAMFHRKWQPCLWEITL